MERLVAEQQVVLDENEPGARRLLEVGLDELVREDQPDPSAGAHDRARSPSTTPATRCPETRAPWIEAVSRWSPAT